MENDTKHYIAKSHGRLQLAKTRTQYSCTSCKRRKVKVNEHRLVISTLPKLTICASLSVTEYSHALLVVVVARGLSALTSPVSRVASI